MSDGGAGGTFPLVERFPSLAAIPRQPLGHFPTPLERVTTPEGAPLWLKRDDRTSEVFGGNKVRALEFLLADVRSGDIVLTIGGEGSTHVLATALHAARLGARTVAFQWPHEMNEGARATAARTGALAVDRRHASNAVTAVAAATLVRVLARLRRRPPGRVHWVPPGGSSPRGVLGHVNAALELTRFGAGPALPDNLAVVVPLGTGGTAAGLALGFAIAELPVTVVAVRVVPRLVGNRRRILSLAHRTRRLIERTIQERIPALLPARVVVDHDHFGGAYGRETAAARRAARWVAGEHGLTLETTYTGKALAAALRLARLRPTLLWLTFDGRFHRSGGGTANEPPGGGVADAEEGWGDRRARTTSRTPNA